MPAHRKLGRPTAQRKAMLRGLVTALLKMVKLKQLRQELRKLKVLQKNLLPLQ